MAHAILALGANIGDPAAQLEKAIVAISANPDITLVARSSVIITPPWGVTDQNEFHNAAILVDTSLTPDMLLAYCLATEDKLGRVRTQKWGPRVIDIDVIAYDRLETVSDSLTLPHPYAHERDFVLVPVREIAPDVAEWLVDRLRP